MVETPRQQPKRNRHADFKEIITHRNYWKPLLLPRYAQTAGRKGKKTKKYGNEDVNYT